MSKVNEELPHPLPQWAAKWIIACSVLFVRSVARFRRKIGADEHDDGCGVFLRGRGTDFERRVALYRVYDDVV